MLITNSIVLIISLISLLLVILDKKAIPVG